jgi:hypothetical protein
MKDRPILNLRANTIEAPGRLDLAEIESLMLFPDSDEDRRNAFQSSIVEWAAQNPDDVPEDAWRELFFISRGALPIDKIQEAARDRFVKGVIVG